MFDDHEAKRSREGGGKGGGYLGHKKGKNKRMLNYKRRGEAEIKEFIQESDSVSLDLIKEVLSREENRREARRMEAWMKSTRAEEEKIS